MLKSGSRFHLKYFKLLDQTLYANTMNLTAITPTVYHSHKSCDSADERVSGGYESEMLESEMRIRLESRSFPIRVAVGKEAGYFSSFQNSEARIHQSTEEGCVRSEIARLFAYA